MLNSFSISSRSRLLREVQANAGSIHDGCGLFSSGWNLILLGHHLAGKSTLLSALKNDQSRRGKETRASFEYNYIDFKDSESENLRRISTWSLDTDAGLDKLLRYALNSRTIWNTLVLICVSFGEPWKMTKTIEKIFDFLGQYISQMDGVDFEEMQDLQNSLERHFRGYIDPAMEATTSSTPGLGITHRLSVTRKFSGVMRSEIDELSEDRAQDEESEPVHPPKWNNLHPNDSSDPDYELPPLGDGAFVKKLRVPIIIVVTKMGKERVEDEQSASKNASRDGTNISLLRDYLCHRLFGEEFSTSAQNLESKSIFIPAGWESQGKLNTLSESIPEGLRIFPSKPTIKQRIQLCNSDRGNISNANFQVYHAFEDDNTLVSGFMPPHSIHFQKKEKFIEAEEKQAFLSRMLSKLKASESRGKVEGRSESNTQEDSAPDQRTRRVLSVVDTAETRRVNLAGPTRESIGAGEASVLSTFFNTLLTKPGGGTRTNAHGRQSEYSINMDSSVLRNLRWRTRFISSGVDAEDAKVEEREESEEQSQCEEGGRGGRGEGGGEEEEQQQQRGESPIEKASSIIILVDITDQNDIQGSSKGEVSGTAEGTDLRINSEELPEMGGQAPSPIDEVKEEDKGLQEEVEYCPLKEAVVEGEQQGPDTAQNDTPQSNEEDMRIESEDRSSVLAADNVPSTMEGQQEVCDSNISPCANEVDSKEVNPNHEHTVELKGKQAFLINICFGDLAYLEANENLEKKTSENSIESLPAGTEAPGLDEPIFEDDQISETGNGDELNADAKVEEREESEEQSQCEEGGRGGRGEGGGEEEEQQQQRGESPIEKASSIIILVDITDQNDIQGSSKGEVSGTAEGTDLRINSEELPELGEQAASPIDEEKEEDKG
ncbi:unnamed protein product [Rodentolepis nana]|uniref:Dynein light intermediate chain n=1 Tax=Rodentolepis nana TaxID=102285 RepID=A0A0R3TR58_RODNA|nr:unnamed protein product [Rodentolepis nana]